MTELSATMGGMTLRIHLAWALVGPDAGPREVSHYLACAAIEALGHSSDGAMIRRCARCGSTTHGVPSVRGSEASISISRSSGISVAAASQGPAIGVDVEWRPAEAHDGLDRVAIGTDDSGHEGDALKTWVRKEAVLKALGTGLAVAPERVVLAGLRVTAPQGPWSLLDVHLAPGWLTAVALRSAEGIEIAVSRHHLDDGVRPAEAAASD